MSAAFALMTTSLLCFAPRAFAHTAHRAAEPPHAPSGTARHAARHISSNVRGADRHDRSRHPGPAETPGSLDEDLAYDSPLRATGHAQPLGLAGNSTSSPLGMTDGLVRRASFRTVVDERHPFQTGTASWYGGRRWQGNRTSSGGRYDENALTAAHASLPLGSRCRVTLVDSDQSVVVTITDRPGTRTRVIDLSRAAAAALGILNRGVAQVALEPI